MKICAKCNVDQPDSNYYSYYHSVQQKLRTRNICNPCMYKQKKEYKQRIRHEKQQLTQVPEPVKIIQPEALKSILDTKMCSSCLLDKPVNEFYLSRAGNPVKMCKECYVEYHVEKSRQKKEDNGGSEHYYKTPNKWTSDIQRRQVFMVMEVCGWVFDESKGIWNKPGLKEDGVFINIIPTVKKEKKKPLVPHGRKIKSGVWNNVDKIVKLIEEGYNYKDVADVFDCSHTTIRSVVTKYRNEKRAD